ncbi:ABC-type glycerol-3-phosphate transport system substrate-binding protein [Kribbella sp. VKM Ac-2527]|uniref:ABC-type glycerol-3-phosphate transport system substrate-binding protein n=1 Tax=Kribbella caucasensis TaxID=2512215 RepID=A0A4V3C9Q6_9ACTN|nr:extracellular solute-binding protein [Kribbella sp. VKM Ac-2527]TDO46749.1 ABC-type glycerol-3-phosphate transport system substrate-binding protein [Kribbella sp. VKM Ac-2527]
MLNRRRTTRAFAALAITTCLTATACSSGSGSQAGGDSAGGVTTIVVGQKPTPDQAAALKTWTDRVAEFEKANPKIKIQGSEYGYDVQTFQADLAAGTLPTVVAIPYTDVQGLIARGQLADITDEVKGSPVGSKINPEVLKIVQDPSGKVFGLPVQAYTMSLDYNRALFKQAGLDPDKPPTTWAEVRTAAKAIADKTGKAGYAMMTTNNTGGWILTAMTYTYGGTIEKVDGSKTVASFNDAPMKNALTQLHQMRWEDNSMGNNFLYNQKQLQQEFAAGNIGMYIGTPGDYRDEVTTMGAKGQDIGVAPLPLDSPDGGTLTGGAVQMFNPKASPEQIAAAVKWAEFFWLKKFTDSDHAISDAKTANADKVYSVGLPTLWLFDAASQAQYNAWIKPYVNTPQANFAPYTKAAPSLKLTVEPPVAAQKVYANLDSVVQTVLTKKDADLDQLLSTSSKTVDGLLAN